MMVHQGWEAEESATVGVTMKKNLLEKENYTGVRRMFVKQ